jgi:hypothetical protein
MSCPGLHCPGCSGAQTGSLTVVAGLGLLIAYWTLPWAAERIWWIGGTIAVCFALAIAASMWLERRSARRAAEWGAARGIYSRADMILPAPALVTAMPDTPAQPAIARVFAGWRLASRSVRRSAR